MLFNFVIGVLLLIISFSVYSTLTEDCSSDDIREKLKISIIIASVLVSISVGYGLCVVRGACDCNFGNTSNAKINTILLFLIALGTTLLWLNYGIKSDLNKTGCNVSAGVLPDILIGICFFQVIVPGLYLIALLTKLYDDDSDDSYDSGDSDNIDEQLIELKDNLLKRKVVTEKELLKAKTKLSESQQITNSVKKKGKKSRKIRAKHMALRRRVNIIRNDLTSIKTKLSEVDSKIESSVLSDSDSDIDDNQSSLGGASSNPFLSLESEEPVSPPE